MTVETLINRIKKYPKGFRFTLPYHEMTDSVRESAYKITNIAKNMGLIKSVSIGAGWNKDGEFDTFMSETFERI